LVTAFKACSAHEPMILHVFMINTVEKNTEKEFEKKIKKLRPALQK